MGEMLPRVHVFLVLDAKLMPNFVYDIRISLIIHEEKTKEMAA